MPRLAPKQKPWLKVLHGMLRGFACWWCPPDNADDVTPRRGDARGAGVPTVQRDGALTMYRDHLKHKARQHDAIRAAPS